MYSRNECVAAVRDFYAFLGQMFMDVESSIIHPPPGGWPNMTSEVMACLGKDDEVIALLRQLPYPEDRPYSDRPDCLPNDAQFQDWKTSADRLRTGKYDKDDILYVTEGDVHRFGNRIPKHCVGLLDVVTERGDGIENVMLLDVTDGLVYWMDCPKHILEVCEPLPVDPNEALVVQDPNEVQVVQDPNQALMVQDPNEALVVQDTAPGEGDQSDDEASDRETPPTSDDDDDEAEDDESDEEEEEEEEGDSDSSDYGDIKWGPCWPVRDFFTMLKNHFVKLNYIPYNHRAIIDIWTDETPGGLRIPESLPHRLQSVYRTHGWPDLRVYKKEECLAELRQVLNNEFPNFY
jgi:hypothetical protein